MTKDSRMRRGPLIPLLALILVLGCGVAFFGSCTEEALPAGGTLSAPAESGTQPQQTAQEDEEEDL